MKDIGCSMFESGKRSKPVLASKGQGVTRGMRKIKKTLQIHKNGSDAVVATSSKYSGFHDALCLSQTNVVFSICMNGYPSNCHIRNLPGR